jgi:hypothetical protein
MGGLVAGGRRTGARVKQTRAGAVNSSSPRRCGFSQFPPAFPGRWRPAD